MSFFTCFCDLPQKEHLRRSPPSPNLVIANSLRLTGDGLEFPALEDDVDDAVILRLTGRHPEVAIGVDLDLLEGPPGVKGQDLVHLVLDPDDLAGMDLDVGRLPFETADVGLVQHDPGRAQGKAVPFAAG